MSWLIDLPSACYWVETTADHIVVKAPPIARWTLGKSITRVARWVEGKGGTVTPLA